MTRLPWDHPTHYCGRCIDHIAFSEGLLKANSPIISCTPTTKKDHGILVGGVSKWNFIQRRKEKAIPERLFRDKEFKEKILQRIIECPKGIAGLACFDKILKEEAKISKAMKTWTSQKCKELGDVMQGIQMIRQRGIVPPKLSTYNKVFINIIAKGLKKRKTTKKDGWWKQAAPWVTADAK